MIAALERSAQRLYQWPSLLLGLASLFWAGNTVAARLAIDEISPLTLTTLRWVCVAAALWPTYSGEIRQHWPQIRPRRVRIVLLALLGMTGFNALYYVAAHYTGAINIGILKVPATSSKATSGSDVIAAISASSAKNATPGMPGRSRSATV